MRKKWLKKFGEKKYIIFRVVIFIHFAGLKPGDVVAVIAPNLNEYTSIVYGGASVGVVYTGVNPTYTPGKNKSHKAHHENMNIYYRIQENTK